MRDFSSDYIDLNFNPLEGATDWSWSMFQDDAIATRTFVGMSLSTNGGIACLTIGSGVPATRHRHLASNKQVTATTVTTGATQMRQIGGVVNSVAGTGQAYIDGVDDTASETIVTGMNAVNSELMVIGANSSHGQQAWGDKGELALWDAALTPDEYAALGQGFSPLLIRPGNLKMYAHMRPQDSNYDGQGFHSVGPKLQDATSAVYPANETGDHPYIHQPL